MQKTLTIRLSKEQDAALSQRAKALGKTRSELVRELIDNGLEEQPLGRRIGHLKGSLQLSESMDPLRRRIRERNWR